MVSLQCEIIKSTRNLMTQTLHVTAFIRFKNVADKSRHSNGLPLELQQYIKFAFDGFSPV